MRKKICRLLACLLSAFLPGCAAQAQTVQLFAANVGKGDALIVKVDDWTGLIDAGKPHVMGRILSALEYLGVDRLDAVFLTHTDNDHAGGLDWLAESGLPVGAWYAPAMFTGVKKSKHPMLKAAEKRGEEVRWLRRGDEIPAGGATLRTLAPARLFTDKDDNNSLVLLLESDRGRILLAGDMELPEEADLLSFGDDLSCAVLKVANHGDDDTTSQAFAQAARPQAAVISTDSREKPGTPDPGVLSRLQSVGATCHVTQNAQLGLLVTLEDAAPRVDYVDIAYEVPSGVYVSRVIPGDDLVTLSNSGADCDLSGWYLYSDRGDELYAFPQGTTLPAGGSLTVGTNSSDGGYDLLWNDKKVIHKSKTDTVFLYDRFGRCVDSRDNGY